MSKNVLPLGKYRKYNAYQAAFDVCAANDAGASADARFKKTILIVIKWLKERYLKSAPEDNAIAAFDSLRQYPDPEEYTGFDPASIKDLEAIEEEEIRICYYRSDEIETESWAIHISEPGLNQETFITDISVIKQEDRVILAVKGAIKVPVNYSEEVSYYRPAFIRMIVNDDLLSLTEAGTDIKYSFGNTAIHINGKSNTECTDFRENFIENPSRQLPVFFVSAQTYDDLGFEDAYMPASEEPSEEESEEEDSAKTAADQKDIDHGRKIVDAAVYAAMGYTHIFVIDGSTRKLFANTDHESLADRLEAGEFVMLGSPETQRDYKTYFELNDKKQMIGSFMTELRRSMERFPYNFGNTEFHRELWTKKRDDELRALVSDGNGNIDSNELLSKTRMLSYMLSITEAEKEQENEDHRREIEELNKKIDKLTREFDKLKNYSESLKEQKQQLKNDNRELSDKVDEVSSEKTETANTDSLSAKDYADRHIGMLNPPAKFQKDMLTDWIDKYYSDTLILHDRARHSLSSADISEQRCRIIASMIHYLHGCTLYWNNGNNDFDNDKTVMKEFVPFSYSFEVALVGSSTTDEYKTKYQLDISAYDENAGTVLMEQHIKYGKGFGNDPTMVRLYYYYDRNIGKTIIGDLPNHLPTYSGGR
ncbi:MAG: hypothetical protein K6F87_03750 [Lachnospiraceae bacterium]|nr:hypothetical protein [Lachnospiraceae bacterium]